MSTSPSLALELRNLRRSFGDVEAVRDLSLDVPQGEVFGFLGPNGAGKTTTIRMVCGLLRPDAGEIRVLGQDLRTGSGGCRRRLGFCPQELVIWERLTCLEQLEFLGRQYGIPLRQARRRARELLGALGLSEKESRLAGTLSGGMKRRLNLALALVHDPQVLVLDEPQAGLDPQSRILVREYILSLAETCTVLLTTHEMDEADRLAGRVGIIDRGRMLVTDSPGALKLGVGGEEVLELRLSGLRDDRLDELVARMPDGLSRLEAGEATLRMGGTGVGALLPAVIEAVEECGAAVDDLTLRTPTLEDVFISLTGRRLRE